MVLEFRHVAVLGAVAARIYVQRLLDTDGETVIFEAVPECRVLSENSSFGDVGREIVASSSAQNVSRVLKIVVLVFLGYPTELNELIRLFLLPRLENLVEPIGGVLDKLADIYFLLRQLIRVERFQRKFLLLENYVLESDLGLDEVLLIVLYG